MNLQSLVFHIEVARVGDSFLVKYDSHNSSAPGLGMGAAIGGTYLFKSKSEMSAWLAALADSVTIRQA